MGRAWAVLAERKMRSGFMMVIENTSIERGANRSLVEDDDMIQAFSVDRTDETLCIRVLPGRSRRRDDLRDPHRSNAMTECRTIGFVPVPQHIARCSVPRKGLGHLARKPILRGIRRDRKVDDASAIKTENDQGIE